jgi:hypothetical protein
MRTQAELSNRLRGRAGARALALGAALAAGMLSVGLVGGQGAILPEVQVTTAAIPDYEFDSARDGQYCPTCNGGDGNSRLVFADGSSNLWVGRVDFQTGDFVPADGRGTLVATDAASATDYGNGPEWQFSTSGSQFVYTKCQAPCDPPNGATAAIGLATQSGGVWSTLTLPGSLGRASPESTLDAADPDPYINYVTADKTAWYFRRNSALGIEIQLPLSALSNGNARRWVPGTRKILFQGHDPNDPQILRDQMYTYDVNSGELEQLTNNPQGVVGGFMWRAPEFNNEFVFFTMAKFRQQILVYRKIPGADRVLRWTIVKTIKAPDALPFFFSPEFFVHNGRSYIFTQVSSSSKFFDRTVPNQLAISGIDPLRQDARLLTNDSGTPRLRLDPEYFITAQGPFIYYTRLIPETASHPAGNDGVWRVDTKLGPPR